MNNSTNAPPPSSSEVSRPENAGRRSAIVSRAALAGAACFGVIVTMLILFGVYKLYGLSSDSYFWAGIVCLVVAMLVYILHAATENRALLAVSAASAFAGITGIYASILMTEGNLADKIIPLTAFSVIVMFILLWVSFTTRTDSEQKRREALRKKL